MGALWSFRPQGRKSIGSAQVEVGHACQMVSADLPLCDDELFSDKLNEPLCCFLLEDMADVRTIGDVERSEC